MRLRIHRSYEWKCTLPLSEIRFGGDNPVTLVSTDVLEYCVDGSHGATWEPVPIFEDPIPEHPRDAKLREDMKRFMDGIDIDAVRQAVIAAQDDLHQVVSGTADPNILLQNKEDKNE